MADEEKSPLYQKLQDLTQGFGIRRPNLRSFLEDELCALWHIGSSDLPPLVSAKATLQLERLIEELPNEQMKLVARVSYNIGGIPGIENLKLMRRRERLPMSLRESQRDLNDAIRQFETSLGDAPPGPILEEELAEARGRPAARGLSAGSEQGPDTDPAHVPTETVLRPLSDQRPPEMGARRVSRVRLAIAAGVMLAIAGGVMVFWILNQAQPNEPQSRPPDTTGGSPYLSSIGPAPGSGKTITEIQGSLGSITVKDPRNPSVTGVKVPPHARVEVACKVYAPSFPSVVPDGYWYRIASAPWNNEWYAIAKNFLNGDQPGGPTEHNTDFAVPDC